jgi:succinyl-diaminopimelate desuccinylase
VKSDLDALSLTRKLLSFDTMNPPGDERDCARYCGSLLEEVGFEVGYYEFDARRTTVIARTRGAGDRPVICFAGHLDTVSLGAAAWRRDPFGGEVDGDRIYGRGSSDMKAGVAAMLLMARRLAKTSRPQAALTLVLTAGEETCCEGAYHVARLGDALGEARALVVGEPTSNYPLIGHKGCVRFELTTRGIAAHASMPELGENAIHKAARAVTQLQAFDFGPHDHPLLGAPTLNVGTISGGININTVPDSATIGIDVRTLPGQAHSAIQESIQKVLGRDVEVRLLEEARSIATDFEHEWVQKVCDIMEGILGERPGPRAASYFTDASVLTPAYGHPPTIILGPGEPTMAHKTDEYCRISKIEEATQAYVEIALSTTPR